MKQFFNKLSLGKDKALAKLKKFDIYNNRRVFYFLPLIVVLVMIICGLCYQFTNTKFDKFANVGVDFQGGTMLTVELTGGNNLNSGDNYNKYLGIISDSLSEKGFKVSVAQSSGDSSIIVRYVNTASVNGELVKYNTDDKTGEMNLLNEEIKVSIENKVAALDNGVSVKSATATLISNSASVKLLKTALLSVGIALAVMLIYIFIRFDFYSAMAAIVALLHDVIIMMSLSVIFYVEIGSTIVAAIITIVAYSINNTIVVFDRIRSTTKPYKKNNQKYDKGLIINNAIFGTMTRTFYTTLTTLVTIALLAIIGVSSIRTFALPIIFGLLAGFYSSVFLAAPLWGVFKEWGEKIKVSNNNKKFKKGKKK